MQVFSKNLKRFRVAKNMTQEHAGEVLGADAVENTLKNVVNHIIRRLRPGKDGKIIGFGKPQQEIVLTPGKK